ncbi:putative bifunctional diguanylate cyclase/phosphodiesterase [Sphingomonas xinjiangensis]|uniref:Diguanylate cyclase (GGDEF)-like protein n=1 Tax=Sphingomonas xinjiangensis TaxID=643568 RepID=A0A840YIM6_9SPHN|nr:EAL domain-containing protein [Sphingomonas xinjiangensis]MBB5711939.1 diguanylate cyclase (GGDEF)-like protein [Sphingomonas xinjiangensis]
MFQFSAFKSAKPRGRFIAFVALPAIGFAVVLVLFGLWSLWITAERSDLATRDRQVREVRLAIGATLDELAQSQAGVAIWDPAVAEIGKAKPDLDWLDQNVGTWLNYVFDHEQDLIIDGDGRPVYFMENGARVRPEKFARVEAGLRPLIEAVRGASREPANPHERLPNQPPHPNSTARTSPVAIHATDLVEIGGKAAVASVMRMVPDSYESRAPAGSEPLLISVRYLNSSLMRDLERVRGLAGARVTHAPVNGASGEYSVPLSSSRGQRIGFFTWRPEMPGKAILASMLLKGGGALVALLALLAAMIASIGRLMRRDARSIAVLEKARLELQAKEAQAQYLANHDPLTGLPNRAAFSRFVEEAIAGMGEQRLVGVMLIDLDRFKNVNDTLGHLAGDKLIQAVAVRLADRVGDDSVVARLGGDEFAICLPDYRDTAQLAKVADLLLTDLRAPFDLMGSSVRVGGSIGIAVCPAQGVDRTELLRKADIAMYRAKEGGRDAYRFFSPEMDESIASRRVIEDDLRAALHAGDQLFVAYQPKLDSSGARIIGLEALVRWRHPTRGELAPDAFISVAEDCGLINPLGEWVLGEACRVARHWPDLSIAVNVSPIQFGSAGVARSICSIAHAAGVSPQQIELEVTESILVENDDTVRAALEELRSAGFRIALDDFGTGYSSLSYLKKFKVDSIKIDKSFVKRLGHDPEAIAIVQAVIALGHAMALSVTAEGVETEEQGCLLRVAGCNELQGFLFSKAVIESELHTLMNGVRTPSEARGFARSLSA